MVEQLLYLDFNLWSLYKSTVLKLNVKYSSSALTWKSQKFTISKNNSNNFKTSKFENENVSNFACRSDLWAKFKSPLPDWEETKKDNRHQRDTLGKLRFIVFFFVSLKKNEAYTELQQIKPPNSFQYDICIKKLTNFEFSFTIGNFRNSGTFLIYKWCKKPINNKKKNTERNVNEKEITFEFHVTLYYCTQYTNWSFLLASLILVYFD